MATIRSNFFNHDFALADNPIVVNASVDFPDGSVFRQVIFEVDTYYDSLNSGKRTHMFAVSADDLSASGLQDKQKSCDISSAIRSSLMQYEYSTENVTDGGTVLYPMVAFSVRVWEKYMLDGELITSEPTMTDGYYYAYRCGLSDYDRWINNSNINGENIPSFSTKPKEGEIFAREQLISSSSYDEYTRRISTSFSIVNGDLVAFQDRINILFVNSRGVYETTSVLSLESEEYEIESEIRGIMRVASYLPSPSVISHKDSGGTVWKMSSGYVNKEWAKWYAHEFLMARHYWMRKNDRWLPVTISPDKDSVMIYDKSDPSLIAINFTIRSAIND